MWTVKARVKVLYYIVVVNIAMIYSYIVINISADVCMCAVCVCTFVYFAPKLKLYHKAAIFCGLAIYETHLWLLSDDYTHAHTHMHTHVHVHTHTHINT